MAEEIQMIPKAGNLIIHSGNIVNWNRLKRKPNQTPTEELSECVNTTLASFLTDADKNQLQYATELDCVHSKYKETVQPDDRGNIKITLKIFLCRMLPPESIKEAVERAIQELNVTFVDVALLAFPDLEDGELSLAMVQPYWRVLQDLVSADLVLSLGIADLSKPLLEELYNWAEHPPVINQVNLDSCCVMPKDLVEYAKLNDIQLLTHNDPKVLLPDASLQSVVRDTFTAKDGDLWEPRWVLRYSALIKQRGIIQSKGYLLRAERDVRKRK